MGDILPGGRPAPARGRSGAGHTAPLASPALVQTAFSAVFACKRVFIPHPAFGYTIIRVPSDNASFDVLKASLRSLLSLLRCTAPPVFLLTTRPSSLPAPAGAAPAFAEGAQDHITRSLVECLRPSLKTNSKFLRPRRRALLGKENFPIIGRQSGIRCHLPLARRLARVFLPPAVFILARKPRVFFRLLTLGRYVGSIVISIILKFRPIVYTAPQGSERRRPSRCAPRRIIARIGP